MWCLGWRRYWRSRPSTPGSRSGRSTIAAAGRGLRGRVGPRQRPAPAPSAAAPAHRGHHRRRIGRGRGGEGAGAEAGSTQRPSR
jgi:hypothetical protein